MKKFCPKFNFFYKSRRTLVILTYDTGRPAAASNCPEQYWQLFVCIRISPLVSLFIIEPGSRLYGDISPWWRWQVLPLLPPRYQHGTLLLSYIAIIRVQYSSYFPRWLLLLIAFLSFFAHPTQSSSEGIERSLPIRQASTQG